MTDVPGTSSALMGDALRERPTGMHRDTRTIAVVGGSADESKAGSCSASRSPRH
jgi:hypothetical protein